MLWKSQGAAGDPGKVITRSSDGTLRNRQISTLLIPLDEAVASLRAHRRSKPCSRTVE
jgi:hypothetical protein